MKKQKILIISIISIILILLNCKNVYADTFSVLLTPDKEDAEYEPGEEAVITVSLRNIDSTNGIYSLTGYLDYKNVFETIESDAEGNTDRITALEGWGDLAYNSNINMFFVSTTSPAKSDKDIMEIRFKIKDDAPEGETTISIKDMEGSIRTDDIETEDTSVVIKVRKKPSPSTPTPGTSTPTPGTSTPTPTPSTTSTPATYFNINSPSATSITSYTTKATTTSGNKLPQTGGADYTLPLLIGASILSIISFIAYIKYKNII